MKLFVNSNEVEPLKELLNYLFNLQRQQNTSSAAARFLNVLNVVTNYKFHNVELARSAVNKLR